MVSSSSPTTTPAILAAAVLALAAPAALAQVPPTRTATESGVPPMPTPPPVQTTPPSVDQPGSVSAWQPTAQPSAPAQPVVPARPVATGPSGPAPEAMPPVSPAVAVDASRRRLWNPGEPLFRRDSRIGAYIAPTFKLTGFGRLPGLMLGADFAISVNERFYFGAAGTALVTPLAAQRSDGRTFNMRTQYAGVTLAVALLQVRFFSLGVGSLIGGGRVCLNDERLDRCVNRAAMFVAEPELTLSFALTKVLRLVASGGYRIAVAQAWSGPDNRILGGWTATLALRLGKF